MVKGTTVKGLTRIGVILVVVGASFLFISIWRSGTITQTEFRHFNPGWSPIILRLWFPGSLKLIVESNGEIDIHILNTSGYEAWRGRGELHPILSLERVKECTYTMYIDRGGGYGILIYNPSDLTIKVKLIMDFRILEEDMILTAAILMGIGLLLIALSWARHRIFTTLQN